MLKNKNAEISKCLRDEKKNQMICIVIALLALSASIFMFYMAQKPVTEFLSLLPWPAKETSLVFMYASTTTGGLVFLSFAIALFVRTITAKPNRKAIQLLSERIENLEIQMIKESE